MTAFTDPRKAKYWPECLLECIDQAAVTTAGQTIATYQCDPYSMQFENMQVESTPSLDMLLATDGIAENMKLRADACLPISFAVNEDHWFLHKITATRTADVSLRMAPGAAAVANVWSRFNYTVRKPTIVDKLRLGLSLDSDESRIATALALEDSLSLELIKRSPSLLSDEVWKQFDEVKEYPFDLGALAAGSTTQIGARLDVPHEWVWVLLGVRVESLPFMGTASDSFFRVDRDNDPSYMNLDLSGMPQMKTCRCYVPFTDKLTCSIVSATGSGGRNVYASYFIGKRPATAVDHIKWGSNFPYHSDVYRVSVEALIEKYKSKGLLDRIKAGTL